MNKTYLPSYLMYKLVPFHLPPIYITDNFCSINLFLSIPPLSPDVTFSTMGDELISCDQLQTFTELDKPQMNHPQQSTADVH